MGIITKTIGLTGWASLAAAGTFVAFTRKSRIENIPPTDYIFNSTLFRRYNPKNSPVTQDICIRRVPLASIKPELLEAEGKLAEAFCAGVWSGIGFRYQRRFLEKKWRGPKTADQLWDREVLAASSYDVGTKLVDHFEVVSKTPTSIIVRCGDSPTIMDVRESDGLFEMTAEIKEAEGVAEFGLKSVFYNGLKGFGGTDQPMPWHVQWLHQLYDKVLMESAVRTLKP
ncbi:hypothetical protein LTR95_001942 [Oleoguttula sp. CCFEE 5521]